MTVYGEQHLLTKDLDQESNNDYIQNQNILSSQFQIAKGNLDPPKVSVINSNHVVSSSNEALDGGTTIRTGQMLDSNRGIETFELMSGSPVVHRALGVRKLVSNNAQKRNESVQNNSIHWKSNIGSPRNEQQKPPGITTDRATRKQPPKPASHVGALKVPDSLKQ